MSISDGILSNNDESNQNNLSINNDDLFETASINSKINYLKRRSFDDNEQNKANSNQ